MLTVDITELSDGIHQLEMDPTVDEAELDPTTFEDLHVDAELQVHRDRILVKLHATATVHLTCDRTLREYDQPVEGQYNLLFGPPSMVGQEGEEFEEVRPFRPSDKEIDLTDVVRDTLLLALPQRQIAPGAEDEPIAREFGAPDDEDAAEDDIDPRWEELRKLRDGNSSD
ncbi:MAG: hypothetical protein BRD55_05205 [Bacteroidetes bacterium SW_9_63_38]|nr:MAG: hypothetical protein BRD55_05205 [Bacteroidetes bacterium SW_9_63_38]